MAIGSSDILSSDRIAVVTVAEPELA